MGIVLRADKGAPLLASEIDGNFSFLLDQITALQAGITTEGIASVSIDGDGISFTGTLGTVWGPIAIPVAIRAKGLWAPDTVYARNDLIQSDSDLYIARQPHTSAAALADDVAAGNVEKAYTGPTADQVLYDDTTSGLSAVTVQAAIDEITARVAALEAV